MLVRDSQHVVALCIQLGIAGASLFTSVAHAQSPVEPPAVNASEPAPKPAESHWYDRLKVRGYTQIRYSRIVSGDEKLRIDADKSVSSDNGFFLRRARLVLQGEVADFLHVYFQPDFAGAASGDTQHLVAIRDWYADIFLDPSTKMFRIRAGQQKVPYGWENLQSSSNRLTLERSDAINSAWPGERDLGLFLFWETPHVRQLYKHLTDSGLKGSGDYGIVAFGATNGQTLNRVERNDDKHIFARVNYPIEIGNQIIEVGANAYTGQSVLSLDSSVAGSSDRAVDKRVGGSIIVYPQPIGFQLEYNVGYGPERSGSTILRNQPLDGGYAMLNARLFDTLFPFVRVVRYDGGRKDQLNAPAQKVKEIEAGIEYTIHKALELTVAFNHSQRTTDGKQLDASMVRTQLQLNY